jgi:hypothetical protein
MEEASDNGALFNTVIILVQHVLISLIGIVGNVLVLVVYVKKLRDKQTITFFIVQLAVADLACCLFLIPINCYHELNIGHIKLDFMCKFHSFLNIVNITYSCLLMTLVAFERYFSIIWPFKIIVTKTRAKVIMFILFVACVVIALLGGLSVGIYHQVHIVFNKGYNGSANKPMLSVDRYSNATVSSSSSSPAQEWGSDLAKIDENTLSEVGPRSSSSNSRGGDLDSATAHFNSSMYQNYTTVWMPTFHCFPNNQVISITYFPYIRLIQNAIVVVCFVIIFILYAFICVFVSKRRQLKANRAQYYKEIMHRSRQNTLTARKSTMDSSSINSHPNHHKHRNTTASIKCNKVKKVRFFLFQK